MDRSQYEDEGEDQQCTLPSSAHFGGEHGNMKTRPNLHAIETEWRADQERRRIAILEVDTFDRTSLTRVGGLDLSFFPSSHGHEREEAVACFVVLSYPSLEVLHESYLPTTLTVPYVAGFLAYREGPPMAQLVEELRRTQPTLMPQVLMVDGNGILHPRGCGLASHVGLLTGVPSIGCAKTFLHVEGLETLAVRKALQEQGHRGGREGGREGGRDGLTKGRDRVGGPVRRVEKREAGGGHRLEKVETKGSRTPEADVDNGEGGVCQEEVCPVNASITHFHSAQSPGRVFHLVGRAGRVWGAAFCPSGVSNPIYVSVGTGISLTSALSTVEACCKYRVPEPVRQADIRSRAWVRTWEGGRGKVEAKGGGDPRASSM